MTRPPYVLQSGPAGLRALARTLCPGSKSGQHVRYTPTGPCIYCKQPPKGALSS